MRPTRSHRAFSREGEGLLDMLFTATIAGIVIAVSLPSGLIAIEHVMATEALMLGLIPRVEFHEARAMSGQWPDRDDSELAGVPRVADGEQGRYIDRIRAAPDGAVHLEFGRRLSSRPGRLTIRGATLPAVAGSPVVWVCGYAAAPPGFRFDAANQTDIAPDSLPSPCRPALHPAGASHE